jgi:hypothetical protein
MVTDVIEAPSKPQATKADPANAANTAKEYR